ncbi:N utilization substance protein B [Candidatus Phycosocius spiralis]|uniref:Transcription antitermination protein NusB n=2 Tax=Candidatus Phycosocius spiralis TaxID=2815099 RepID=A0ABQ4PSB0_9PROT|nr:N utilization substance protein B [Candidatus Phycosocius spiralis]
MSRTNPQVQSDARRGARLAAVQALYQMEMSGGGVTSTVLEYLNFRLGEDSEVGPLETADADFFRCVVEGVVAEQALIDASIKERLAEGWRLERIDSIVRAAVRAATYELLRRVDVPVAVVIDEYVGIVNAFFDGPESGFTNGLLDRLARELNANDLRQLAC